jgi:hypothetical protein
MAAWEEETWKPLVEMADHVPEAGIHLQSNKTHIIRRQQVKLVLVL